VLYLLPVMLVLMIAKWVGDPFNISLYDLHLNLKGIPFVEAEPSQEQQFQAACHIMKSPVVCLREIETVGNIYRVLDSCSHNGFPVVTTETKNLVGLATRNQLVVLLNKLNKSRGRTWSTPTSRGQYGFSMAGGGSTGDFTEDYLTLLSELNTRGIQQSPAAPQVSDPSYAASLLEEGTRGLSDIHPLDFCTSLSSTVSELPEIEFTAAQKELSIDLRPFMNPVPLAVQEACPVSRVFRVFRGLGIRHLAVTDVQNHVVGMITRKELCHGQNLENVRMTPVLAPASVPRSASYENLLDPQGPAVVRASVGGSPVVTSCPSQPVSPMASSYMSRPHEPVVDGPLLDS